MSVLNCLLSSFRVCISHRVSMFEQVLTSNSRCMTSHLNIRMCWSIIPQCLETSVTVENHTSHLEFIDLMSLLF